MPRPYVSVDVRRLVIERAGGCCEYCRCPARYATEPFVIEHIRPRSRGGTSFPDNLGFACSGCNGHKYNKDSAPDPIADQGVPLFHPRLQHWQEHFSWNEDFTLMIGMTPSGRATVVALHLNRPGVVNLRRLLLLVGEHPPGGLGV
jgi:hypothetical protein